MTRDIFAVYNGLSNDLTLRTAKIAGCKEIYHATLLTFFNISVFNNI